LGLIKLNLDFNNMEPIFKNTIEFLNRENIEHIRNLNLTVNRNDFNIKKRIKISDIKPMQERVDMKIVSNKQKGSHKYSIVYVVEHNNNKILIDGHHTVIAKLLNGQKYIYCLYCVHN